MFGVVLAIQAAAIAGLITRSETMQPQQAAARAAADWAGRDGLVLLPRGNDGVGVAGVFLLSAPSSLRVMVLSEPPDLTQALPRRVVLALLGLDQSSRATSAALAAAFTTNPCWRAAGDAPNLRAYDRICD